MKVIIDKDECYAIYLEREVKGKPYYGTLQFRAIIPSSLYSRYKKADKEYWRVQEELEDIYIKFVRGFIENAGKH